MINVLWGMKPSTGSLYVMFFNGKIKLTQFILLTVSSTCRKEQVREYYTENDCRSRQPLKYAKCVGGCGNQCCAAKIVRRRKV